MAGATTLRPQRWLGQGAGTDFPKACGGARREWVTDEPQVHRVVIRAVARFGRARDCDGRGGGETQATLRRRGRTNENTYAVVRIRDGYAALENVFIADKPIADYVHDDGNKWGRSCERPHVKR